MALRAGASHSKTGPCIVWCPYVSCIWRYNAFNLSRDVTIPTPFGWDLLKVCYHLGQSCEIGIMMVSMMVSFDRHYIWPHVKTCLNGCLNLWVESIQGVLRTIQSSASGDM